MSWIFCRICLLWPFKELFVLRLIAYRANVRPPLCIAVQTGFARYGHTAASASSNRWIIASNLWSQSDQLIRKPRRSRRGFLSDNGQIRLQKKQNTALGTVFLVSVRDPPREFGKVAVRYFELQAVRRAMPLAANSSMSDSARLAK